MSELTSREAQKLARSSGRMPFITTAQDSIHIGPSHVVIALRDKIDPADMVDAGGIAGNKQSPELVVDRQHFTVHIDHAQHDPAATTSILRRLVSDSTPLIPIRRRS